MGILGMLQSEDKGNTVTTARLSQLRGHRAGPSLAQQVGQRTQNASLLAEISLYGCRGKARQHSQRPLGINFITTPLQVNDI